jgi:hypothetical protein
MNNTRTVERACITVRKAFNPSKSILPPLLYVYPFFPGDFRILELVARLGIVRKNLN